MRPIQEDHGILQARFSSDRGTRGYAPLAVMQTETEVELRDKNPTKLSHEAALRAISTKCIGSRTLTERLLLPANNHDIASNRHKSKMGGRVMNRSLTLAHAKKITIDNQVGQAMVTANTESLADAHDTRRQRHKSIVPKNYCTVNRAR